MIFHSISVQGFRSFSGKQVWSLEANPAGLYHLTGRNDVEPELEANGAGKSTLFEAVYWCLYGRTSRGLKASNVQCWLPKSPKCKVEIALAVTDRAHPNGRIPLRVCRTWSPNTLELDGAPVDQATLEQAVGIGPEAFLQAIYHAQFSPSFVDLPPAERLSLLSEVLQLERWEHAAEQAGKLSREMENTSQQLREQIARKEGALSQLRAKNWKAQSDTWTTGQQQKIKAKESELSGTQKELDRAKGRLKLAQRQTAKTEGAPDFSSLETQVKDARTELWRMESELNALLRDKTSATRQLSDAQSLKTGVKCSACKQLVTKEHAAKEIAAFKQSLSALVEKEEPLRVAVDQAKDSLSAAEQKLAGARERDRQRQEGQLAAARALSVAESEVRQLEQRWAHASSDIEQLRQQLNPYLAEAKRAAREIAALEKELNLLRGDLEESERLARGAAYWQKGFRDLRLYVVDHMLAQLEIETNNHLVHLGLSSWAIKFFVEQETKSGTLRRGFSILVKAPYSGEELIPFEAWSGGESQRLRLAISMGLADLILGQLGMQCNLEFWDEPSTWLSAGGITELLDTLSERARGQRRQLWLADHRSLDYGGFAGQLLVAKTGQGSALETTGSSEKVRETASNRTTAGAPLGLATGKTGRHPLRLPVANIRDG